MLVRLLKPSADKKKTYLGLKRHHLVSIEPVVGGDEASVMAVTMVMVVTKGDT